MSCLQNIQLGLFKVLPVKAETLICWVEHKICWKGLSIFCLIGLPLRIYYWNTYFFISSKKVLTRNIIMYDSINDPIGSQTSVGRNFRQTYNFKVIIFFFYIQLLIMRRLFNRYYSSVWHQKPDNFIFSVWFYLKNSCFENCYVLKNST